MRITCFAFVRIALGIAAPASSQTTGRLVVEVADAPPTAVVPAKAPYTDGGIVVAARPLKPGVTLLATAFRVRAMLPSVARRVAAPPVPLPRSPALYRTELYRGDVPTDPAMRPWQPPSRGSR